MYELVASLRVLGTQHILLDRAGHAAGTNSFAIQRDGQLGVRTAGKDVGALAGRFVLRPRLHVEIDIRVVGDGLAVFQVDLDFDLFVAAMLVRKIELELVARSIRSGGRHGEQVVAVFFSRSRSVMEPSGAVSVRLLPSPPV